MATGKRASMREGPLAELFRRTTNDPAPASREPEAPEVKGAEPEPEPEPAQPAPLSPAAQSRRATPHPSLDADVRAPVPGDTEARPAPTPQERLRQAFSSDIPDNMLEPPASSTGHDVYARSERDLDAFPPPLAVGRPLLRVVGVGGAGVNAVNRMVEAGVEGVEFLAINTDLQSLQLSAAGETLHIGDAVTRGLGSGSDPELGRRAAREEYDRIKAMLRGADMVFIA
ncbi:MAG: cell division protein FtsZ, partial [Solirubrobacteraceae bacterium]